MVENAINFPNEVCFLLTLILDLVSVPPVAVSYRPASMRILLVINILIQQDRSFSICLLWPVRPVSS